MKQILQNIRSGETVVAEVPCPAAGRGQVLIRTSRTLISAGTERMLVEFGKAGWLEKARQQPDKVRMVLDKVRTDGLVPTFEAVRNKLDQPLPLGYCNVGTVMESGAGVTGLARGDRVVSNGKHAQAVAVPVNLCARVPDAVSDEAAAFTVLASIGLQGVRLIEPTLGEAVVVSGLGLIGLLSVQLLRAHGCRVLGVDFDPARLAMARRFGAEVVDLSLGQDPVAQAQAFSRGRGVDAVLVTASTSSSELMHQAAQMCRKRGRIVLVGVVGLELSRADFYEKEISFRVSCSYGPGRYDPNYEEKGQDYPVGFVRWTEQRNFEAVLDMMADGRLDVAPLLSHRFDVAQAQQAYELIAGSEPSLGVLLEYPGEESLSEQVLRQPTVNLAPARGGAGGIAFIGAGNYAGGVLIPAFRGAGARLRTIASASGVSGAHMGAKFGFEVAATSVQAVLDDAQVGAVVIATRHDSHAELASRALAAGKAVFVEKPLALTLEQLEQVREARDAALVAGKPGLVMVGFNRRFAPQVQKIASLLQGVPGAKAFVMTVNAGAIPATHWTQDKDIGGGRILGEACHFIDLLRFLAAVPITQCQTLRMGEDDDKATISLRFADGSTGVIHYLANGHKSFAKERLEVFAAGRILQLDNFRKLKGFGWPGFKDMNLWRQDKGQGACAAAFVNALRDGRAAPIDFDELIEVSRITIEAAQSLRG